jgi:membrane protease YdiL (CAAX protease family)
MPDPSRLRTTLLALSACFVLAGVALTARRVLTHERGELEHESTPRSLAELERAPGSTRVSARLTEVTLEAGEHAIFELCAADRLEPARWSSALELVVFELPAMALMLRVPLDAEHLATAQRRPDSACMKLGGGTIERAGRYSVDAVWPAGPPRAELRTVKLQARVLALRQLSRLDRSGVLAIGLGVALLLAGLLVERDRASGDDGESMRDQRWQRLLFGAVAISALLAATHVPSAGATFTLLKGVCLVLLQAGAALLFCRIALPESSTRTALALAPPARRLGAWLGAALVTAALLVLNARLALRLVPATGEAPIQTFVSWPSGMLCFAALGALLPLGEELFFRGYLYRLLLGFGRAAAFWSTLVLFVALHAEQSWGNWGGLVSIAVTGLALTTLRASSGSVLIPAAAHLLYNFTLSMASF